ncbi:hypothetical protein FHY55_03505 [Oceanicola sp. D3]|uniref:hypothetical protein n=1 Tax=Oceanicola sp. D3 TaxID=2587163 RepID=UPI00112011E3|nr:hypothetical protein [Oceanicola sp. D3]QDC08365.1 hypothetical protein FHY55_03505 [Oceanicola sp. D3]
MKASLSHIVAFAWALALGAGGTLHAETVRVLTGEHDGFTRIALALARGSDWKAGRIEDGFGLELARTDIRLDLSGAFDLIQRDRILDLSFDAETRRLSIRSQCDCHAQAFQIGTRVVVIDIADGPAPDGHPFDAPLDLPEPAPPVATSSEPEPAATPRRQPTEVAAEALPPLLSDELRRRYDRQVTLPAVEPPPAPPKRGAEERETPKARDAFAEAEQRRRIAEIEAELLKQLARAGSQGMVKPNPEYGGADGGVSQPDASSPPSNHPGENVDAITGVDRAAPDAPAPQDDSRQACLPPAAFEFLVAEPEAEPHEMISNARQALLREFDSPDAAAAGALVRSYLYLGFGAEARQVVDAFLAETPQAPLYLALAAALDNTPELAGQGLSGQSGCPGAASFWAMLVGPVPAALSEETRRAVAATASDLPVHLRRWVVPRLAQRLLDRGHEELAAALRDSLLRVEGEHGTGYQMLQAALAERGDIGAGGDGPLSEGSRRTAEALLTEVAESNQSEAPEALVELIRLANEQGRVLPPDRMDLAEALIFEHRDTPLARTLLISLAPQYARDGEFAKALSTLDQAAGMPADSDPDPLPEALDSTAALLAETASDEVFLRIMFDPARASLGVDVTEPTGFALANRLLALGFPEQALAQSESLPPEPDYRLMRVRALMALGRNERALASLAGLQGTESDALRGELLARLGEHDRAHTMSRIAGDEEAARRAAWASGNVDAIRESGTDTEAGFTEATRPENAPQAPGQPTLAGAQELLDQIRQRRAAIETLLQEKSSATGETAVDEVSADQPPGT